MEPETDACRQMLLLAVGTVCLCYASSLPAGILHTRQHLSARNFADLLPVIRAVGKLEDI